MSIFQKYSAISVFTFLCIIATSSVSNAWKPDFQEDSQPGLRVVNIPAMPSVFEDITRITLLRQHVFRRVECALDSDKSLELDSSVGGFDNLQLRTAFGGLVREQLTALKDPGAARFLFFLTKGDDNILLDSPLNNEVWKDWALSKFNPMIRAECEGMSSVSEWRESRDFTIEQGRDFFIAKLGELLVPLQEPNATDALLGHILPLENFRTSGEVSYKRWEFINPEDSFKKQYAEYRLEATLLENDIYSSLEKNRIEFPNRYRIDHRYFLLAPDLVRRFYSMRRRLDNDLADEIFSSKYFGLPDKSEERNNHFLQADMGILTQEAMDNVFRTAVRIAEIAKPGDRVVVFGNTPYFVGRALGYLVAERNIDLELINFPFSGSPNKTREGSFTTLDDVVTPDRLDHLKSRLDQAGLMSSKPYIGTAYFLDVIGSGAGPAYAIETILRDFQDKQVPLPKIEMISLNEFTFPSNTCELADPRQVSIADHPAKDGETVTLSFPSKEDVHFSLPCSVIKMPGHGAFDLDEYHSCRIVPQYNAYLWEHEYDHVLTRQLDWDQQLLLDHFDANILHRLAN